MNVQVYWYPYDYPNDVGRYSMSKDVSPLPCYKRKVGWYLSTQRIN